MTSSRTFLEGRYILLTALPALGILSLHEQWFHSCCYGKWPQGGSMSLCPALVTAGPRALGKVLFLDCQEWKVPEEAPKGCVPFSFLPYPCPLDTSQFLQHHSGESAFIRRWEDPKERGWRWEPHQETRSPRGFSKLFQPRGSMSFAAVGIVSLQEDLPGSGGCGPGQREGDMPGPWGRAHWLAHPPQLRQPRDSPSSGTKSAQASGT